MKKFDPNARKAIEFFNKIGVHSNSSNMTTEKYENGEIYYLDEDYRTIVGIAHNGKVGSFSGKENVSERLQEISESVIVK